MDYDHLKTEQSEPESAEELLESLGLPPDEELLWEAAKDIVPTAFWGKVTQYSSESSIETEIHN